MMPVPMITVDILVKEGGMGDSNWNEEMRPRR